MFLTAVAFRAVSDNAVELLKSVEHETSLPANRSPTVKNNRVCIVFFFV